MSCETPTKSTIRRGRDVWVILACLGLLLSVSWFFNPVRASSHSSRTLFRPPTMFRLPRAIEDRTHAEPTARQLDGTGKPTLLFGVDTEPVADGELPERLAPCEGRLFLRPDLETVARCHANGPCIAAAPSLIAIVAEGIGHSGRARIGMINRAVNLAIRPMSDQAQWGVPDRWSAPFEKPCNPVEAIVRITRSSECCLAGSRHSRKRSEDRHFKTFCQEKIMPPWRAHVDGQWLILDNRTLTLVSDKDVTRAIPEYVLDQNGVTRFVWTSPYRRQTRLIYA